MGDKFDQMDTNKDGKVSREEFKALFPNMRDEAFVAIDQDGDGFISIDEWNAFMKDHSSGMRPNRGMGGGPMGAPGDPMMPNPGNPDLPLVTPPNGNYTLRSGTFRAPASRRECRGRFRLRP